MSVSAIGSALIAASQKVASNGTSTTTSSTSPAAVAQEFAETQAQTTKEAQHGDPVAKKKLAQLLAKEQQQSPQELSTEPGKGTVADHIA